MATRSVLDAVALIEPMGDVGIGGYTHELAESLCEAGLRADVFSRQSTIAALLPRQYRLFTTLDSEPGAAGGAPCPTPPTAPSHHGVESLLDPYFDLLAHRAAEFEVAPAAMRRDVTSAAAHSPSLAIGGRGWPDRLAKLGYTAVWTQWPLITPEACEFVRGCRAVGLPVIHTVHNVFPHERFEGDHALLAAAYGAASALITHSEASARSLRAAFPEAALRVAVSHHGTYSIFPRVPQVRAQVRDRLGATEDTSVYLMFGGIRPYKNIDAMLEAVAMRDGANELLVVAGWEWGYPDQVPGDRLGRTRRRVRDLGLGKRVRLLPGPFGLRQGAELFEAADAVVLPYLESYGSGVLLLALTFGRHIVTTTAGGAHEYLQNYPEHTLLAGPDARSIAAGLGQARRALAGVEPGGATPPQELAWSRVVARLLPQLERLLSPRSEEACE